MKRVVIVAALLLLCSWVSAYSVLRVTRLSDRVMGHIEASERYLAQDDAERLASEVKELEKFWDKEEKILSHFIRHHHLDSINVSVARLPALAYYGDKPNLAAELECIRWQIEHLKENETKLSNVF